MIPRDGLVLCTLKNVETFVVIRGVIGAIIRIVISEVNSNSSLNTFIGLVDS